MNVYKKLMKYIPGQGGNLCGACITSAVSAVFSVGGFYLIYQFLQSIMGAEVQPSAATYAWQTALALTLGAILYILSGLFSHKVGFRLETNLRKRGIEGLARSGFRFYDTHSSGLVRKSIDDNAAQTHTAVAHLIPDASQAFVVPVLSLVLGFVVSWRVGLVLLVLTALGLTILFLMMGESKFMAVYQEALGQLSAETVEYVRGMQVIKVFGAKVDSFKNLYKAIQDYSKYAYQYSKSCKGPYVWYQVIFFGLMAMLLLPMVIWRGALGPVDFLAVEIVMTIFLSGTLFVSFMRMMWTSMYIFQANYAVDTLEKLYGEMQEDVLQHGEVEAFDSYDIRFRNVTFGYTDQKVLEDLSFVLPAGKTYALVGSSGSGKSTIAKLISGFYRIDGGSIEIGGRRLEDYSSRALTKAISFVFQDSKLFKTTLYENVAIGRRGATREEVLAAMEASGCMPILDKFPKRESTVIGSKGVYLSGGEKQRIAIARAMLKDAPIVIMDEAAAAIDPDNEHALQQAFKNLMRGKTVIMIAHRLSSIRNVDEILVLERGQIIERGSHDQLLRGESKYKELLASYNMANEWRVK